jgi:hypothetical protein
MILLQPWYRIEIASADHWSQTHYVGGGLLRNLSHTGLHADELHDKLVADLTNNSLIESSELAVKCAWQLAKLPNQGNGDGERVCGG